MTLGKDHFYIETYSPHRAEGFRDVQIGVRSSAIFEVDHIKTFIEDARQKGANIIREPVQQFWGDWNAIISDPDGNEFIIDSPSE